jgi:hypothetical protein
MAPADIKWTVWDLLQGDEDIRSAIKGIVFEALQSMPIETMMASRILDNAEAARALPRVEGELEKTRAEYLKSLQGSIAHSESMSKQVILGLIEKDRKIIEAVQKKVAKENKH